MADDVKISHQWSTLNFILSIINSADSKASAALAINSLIVGFIFSMIAALATSKTNSTFLQGFGFFTVLLFVLGALALFVSLFSSLACLTGRTGIDRWDNIVRPEHTLMFFGHIVTYDRDTYTKEVAETTPEAMLADVSGQIHVLSQIAMQKYAWLNRAYWALAGGIFLFAVLGIVIFF
jgi:hypothetical protein